LRRPDERPGEELIRRLDKQGQKTATQYLRIAYKQPKRKTPLPKKIAGFLDKHWGG
jgi:hypothetical protein